MGTTEQPPVSALGGVDLLGKAGGNSNQLLEPSGGGTTDFLSAMMGPGAATGGPVLQPPGASQQEPMNLLNNVPAFGGDSIFPGDTTGQNDADGGAGWADGFGDGFGDSKEYSLDFARAPLTEVLSSSTAGK